MEKECSQCHRPFRAAQEDMTVCPDCLKKEFAAATRLNAEERKGLESEYKFADRRQIARAERMNEAYQYEGSFSMAGKLRFAFGCLIYGLAIFFILLVAGSDGVMSKSRMDSDSLRAVSVIICTVSAFMVAFASPRHRLISWPLGLLILISGWYMPELREKTENNDAVYSKEELKEETKKPETPVAADDSSRALTQADLEVFYRMKKGASPSVSFYAVYMNNQSAQARELVRESLTRLTEAEYTRAYTRASGALYIIANVPGKQRNISDILSRYGKTTYAAPAEGVYEVRFDADKANLASRYSADVLTSPLNASFVTANISELGCLDTMRVRTAATALRNANVPVLRREVHDAFTRALKDPWGQDNDTYAALVTGLVTYSEAGDANTTAVCRKFFQARKDVHKEIPQSVTAYLIQEVPDEMAEPVLELWFEDPLAWGAMLDRLGARAQAPLLHRLKEPESVGQMNAILKYLKDHGTAEAVPAVKEVAESTDSNLIRRSAEEALRALQSR